MKQYKISWGSDVRVVWAENETDAWAEFVRATPAAQVNPKLYKREIKEEKHATDSSTGSRSKQGSKRTVFSG